MRTEYRYMSIPTAENHRFALRVNRHNPVAGGAATLVLQRQKFGPFWTDLDSRMLEAYTKTHPRQQIEWIDKMEEELVSEWFAQEIYELRN